MQINWPIIRLQFMPYNEDFSHNEDENIKRVDANARCQIQWMQLWAYWGDDLKGQIVIDGWVRLCSEDLDVWMGWRQLAMLEQAQIGRQKVGHRLENYHYWNYQDEMQKLKEQLHYD